MNPIEVDLLQYKEKKDPILGVGLSFIIAYFLYAFIVTRIWMNYKANWVNFYQVTSSMVFFLIMFLWAIYVAHGLRLRYFLYFILAFFSVLVYLDGVNKRIPIIDSIILFTVDVISNPGDKEELSNTLYSMKDLIGDSFYEALLTWVIIDVPLQMLENKQATKWETSVKYVYHSIFNQILLFASMNSDISTIRIQQNQVHSNIIESFCKKKIKCYSRRMSLCRKDSRKYDQYLQTKKQYEHLLSLLQEIQSNPNNLNGREYLKLLYEIEAIFKRSKIINSFFDEHKFSVTA